MEPNEENVEDPVNEIQVYKPLAQRIVESMRSHFDHLESLEIALQGVEERLLKRSETMDLDELMKFYSQLISRVEKKQNYFLKLSDLGMRSELFKRFFDLDEMQNAKSESNVEDVKLSKEEMERRSELRSVVDEMLRQRIESSDEEQSDE